MFPIAGVQDRQDILQPVEIGLVELHQSVDIEGGDWSTLENRCNSTDNDVLDAVLVKEFKYVVKALTRHRGART